MKYTLLKMVQLILSSTDSDEVNSISDTTESQQIVDIIESTYNDIASTIDFPDEWDFFELSAADAEHPTLLALPDNVGHLEYIHYDSSDPSDTVRNYAEVIPLGRRSFFERMSALDTADTDVYSFNLEIETGTFDVRGYNNKNPVYYTTTNDNRIIFDNFDISKGQTIIAGNTRCYGNLIPTFLREDDFVPQLEPRQFTLLFNEAKSQAWVELRQVTNAKAEQKAKRGWMNAHRKTPQLPNGEIKAWKPDYGRYGSSPRRNPLNQK